MKDEKYKPASPRQFKRMVQLGLEPYSDITGHRASQMINEAVAKLGLGRGERLSSVDRPLREVANNATRKAHAAFIEAADSVTSSRRGA